MRGFSKATIAGNLVRDPEMRATSNGTNVTSLAVAVNRVYKVNGEQREEVSYIDCVAWGKLGEMFNQHLKKGDPILVSGRLNQRRWEDKETGKNRSAVEIVVDDFTFLGRGDAGAGGNSGSYAAAANNAPVAAASPAADVVPEDVPEDGEIDLSEVPF
ncbi:single-stranded DNA-binding protein [Candidatus Saccharibacteria bacterium]|nr:single-stranded DNA-binding protein [Candidatus Saccharibacteria bacterium]